MYQELEEGSEEKPPEQNTSAEDAGRDLPAVRLLCVCLLMLH